MQGQSIAVGAFWLAVKNSDPVIPAAHMTHCPRDLDDM